MAYKLTPYDRRVQAQLIRAEREARYLKNKPFAQRVANTDTKKKNDASGATKALHTAGDVGANLVTGAAKGLEGIWDLGAGLVGAVGGLFSDKFEDNVKAHVAKDHVGEWFGNAWQEGLDQSALNDSTVGGIIEGVAQGVGQMLPAVAVTLIPGVGPALGAKLALGTTMASAAGTGTEQAFADGAGYGQGLTYGAMSGAIEGVTEKLLPGAGDLYGKALTKMGKRAVKEVGAEVAEVGIKRAAKEALGEGAEEVLSELANPVLKSIYKGTDAFEEYGDSEYWKGVAEAGIIGMGTSAAYGGTVGRMTKTTGKYADARATLEHIEEQRGKIATGELTLQEEVQAQQNIKADYEQLSVRLQKASDKTRANVLKNPQLAAAFESDGMLKADFTAQLDNNIKAAGDTSHGFNREYYSATARGREAEIAEGLAREGTKIYDGTLTAEETENLNRLRKAHTALSRRGLVGTDFVLSEVSPKFNAYLDGKTVVIGKDTLTDGTYIQKLVHEVEHFTEGTKEWEELASFVFDGSAEVNAAIDIVANSGYGITQEDVDTLGKGLKSGNLTKGQKTLISEVVALRSEALFGSEQTIAKLTRENRTLAEKILDRIKQFLQVFTAKTLEEKAQVKRLQEAQRLFERALGKAGAKYALREMQSAQNRNIALDGEGEVQFSRMNNLSLGENVDRVMEMSDAEALANKEEGNYVSVMKTTPAVVTNFVADAKNLEIVMRFDAFYLATRKSGVLEGHYHNYGEVMKNLPEILNNPLAVVRMDNGRLNILAMVPHHKGNNNIISVELNTVKDINSEYKKYNLIITVTPAKDNYVRNILSRRAVKVEYQKEDLSQVNNQLYEWLAIVNDKSSNNSIPQSDKMSTPSAQENSDRRQFSRKGSDLTDKQAKNDKNQQADMVQYSQAREGEGYTEEQYRDFGWVRDNDVIPGGAWEDFTRKLADVLSGRAQAPKTKSGEYMIAVSDIYDSQKEGVNNIIVYAKGEIDSPQVSRVLTIDLYDETSLDEQRRDIYALERRGVQPKIGGVFHLHSATDSRYQRYGQGNHTQSGRYYNQLGADRGRSGTAANRIKEFKVNSDGGYTTVYADGRIERDTHKVQYSMAGKNAKTANKSLLARAQQMLSDGVDSESIRLKTGWFQGYDGEWRFEIDDSAMTFQESPFHADVLEYRDLQFGHLMKALNEADEKRYAELHERLQSSSLNRLEHYVKHDALFEAYPALREVTISFTPMSYDSGTYDPKTNHISINSELSYEQKKEVLIHELQHAVQFLEGFAIGANDSYWVAERYGGTEYERACLELKDIMGEIRREWAHDMLETFMDFRLATKEYDRSKMSGKAAKLYDKLINNRADGGELFKRFIKAYRYITKFELRHKGETARDLYYRTAGEIEARDVARRANMTAEQRISTRPDIDRRDAVLANRHAGFFASRSQNGNALLDGEGEVQYNYKDLYTTTDEYIREVAAEDRPDFDRWLANKTSGLVEGRVKTVEIYCGSNIYWFKATGYMQGEMRRVVDANDIDGYENSRKEFENEAESNRETFDSWSVAVSSERAGEEGDISHSQEQRGENGAYDLFAGEQERNSTGDQGSGYTDYRIDNDEVERIIKGLREMLAKTDEESGKQYSRKIVPIESSEYRDLPDTVNTTKNQKTAGDLPQGSKIYEHKPSPSVRFTRRHVNEMSNNIRRELLTFTMDDGTEVKGEIPRRDGWDLDKWLYETLNTANLRDRYVLAGRVADRVLAVAVTENEQSLRDVLGEEATSWVREDLTLSIAALLGDKQAQIENERKNAHFDTMRKLAEEMRDVEKGRFYSATVYDGDTLRAIPNMLRAALKTSRAFTGSIRNTLVKVKDWYCAEDNAMMYKAVNDEHNEGMANGQVVFDKDIAAMLEELTTGTGALSVQELEMVVDIAKHFQKLSERYQRVFINGKWVDAEQMAEEMVSIMQSAKKDQNWLVHGIVSKYMRQFGDPAALFRAMDGYDRNGFYIKMHEWMRNAAISMQADELHALREYYEWHKKHKKWAKHLEHDLVEFRGEKMTVGQLMTLYCESKTEKSKQGLADNGFKFTDKDGKPHRIKGLIYEQGKGEKASRKHKRADVERACKQLENEIWSMLSEYQRAYIKLLENVLNTTCRKWKIDTDTLMKGFSRVHERGYYFPSAHNGIAKTVDTTFYEGDRVGHLSLNKEAVEGARGELIIEGIDDVVLRHVHNMALYKNYAIVAENRSMLQNIDVGRVDGKGERVKNVHQPVTIRTTNEEYGKQRGTDMMKLLDKMSKDLQGCRRAGQDEQSFLKDLVEQIRGNYARFQLGLNPKTLATQLSSLIAAGNILEYNSIVRGIKGFGSKETALLVDKYCPLAELRNFDNSAALAAGVLETTGKVGDVLMKGIGFVDRRVICSLFYACQLQVEKDSKLALGTEENLKAAGELLTRVILETQQNSLVTEKSDAMRGGIFSRTFTMFTADGMKVIGRWFDALGEWAVIKRRLQNAKTDADKARLQKELKRAQGQAARSTAALVGQAIYMVLISYLFRLLYDKDEEKAGDNVLQGAWDFAGGLIGGLPIVRDVYSYFTDGYELDNFFLSTINDVLVATKDSFNVAMDALSGKDVSRQDVFDSVRKVTYAAGQMFGIPVRNAYNFATGLTRRFVPTAGYTVDSLFASKAYSTDLAKAIENEDEHMVETIAGLMIDEKIGIEDKATRDIFKELAGKGYSVLPRSVGDTVIVNGEEHALTGRQQKRLRTVYAVGEEAVADMCRLKQFAEAEDEVQAKAIQFIYGIYWDLAVEDVLGVELAEKNVLFAEAIDIEKLAIIIAQARSLEADKDKDGKAIAGTKKRKVERFVASLRLTAAQKYMVMGYLGYTNANGRAQVESYIGGLKLTKTEKAALLKYSGYAA